MSKSNLSSSFCIIFKICGAIVKVHLKCELPESSNANTFESTANFFFPLIFESQNSMHLCIPSR